MDYFVEAVDSDGNRHWSDTVAGDQRAEDAIREAREFMVWELSGVELTFRLYRIEENHFASAPMKAEDGDVRLHNFGDVA